MLISTLAVFYVFFFSLDKRITEWFASVAADNSLLQAVLEAAEPFVDFISHGATLIALSVVFCIIGRFTSKRSYEAGQLLILGFLSSGIVVQVLKHLTGRARPRGTYETVFRGPALGDLYHSFPSGHTSVVFCMACILTHYFPRHRWAFYSLAVVTGFNRVAQMNHFSSDVIAGAIVGVAVARLLLAYVPKYALKQKTAFTDNSAAG